MTTKRFLQRNQPFALSRQAIKKLATVVGTRKDNRWYKMLEKIDFVFFFLVQDTVNIKLNLCTRLGYKICNKP